MVRDRTAQGDSMETGTHCRKATTRNIRDIETYTVTYMGALMGEVGKRIGFRIVGHRPVERYWVARTHKGYECPTRFKTRKAAMAWVTAATLTGTHRDKGV